MTAQTPTATSASNPTATIAPTCEIVECAIKTATAKIVNNQTATAENGAIKTEIARIQTEAVPIETRIAIALMTLEATGKVIYIPIARK